MKTKEDFILFKWKMIAMALLAFLFLAIVGIWVLNSQLSESQEERILFRELIEEAGCVEPYKGPLGLGCQQIPIDFAGKNYPIKLKLVFPKQPQPAEEECIGILSCVAGSCRQYCGDGRSFEVENDYTRSYKQQPQPAEEEKCIKDCCLVNCQNSYYKGSVPVMPSNPPYEVVYCTETFCENQRPQPEEENRQQIVCDGRKPTNECFDYCTSQNCRFYADYPLASFEIVNEEFRFIFELDKGDCRETKSGREFWKNAWKEETKPHRECVRWKVCIGEWSDSPTCIYSDEVDLTQYMPEAGDECLCWSDEPCLIDLCRRHQLSPEICVNALYGVEIG